MPGGVRGACRDPGGGRASPATPVVRRGATLPADDTVPAPAMTASPRLYTLVPCAGNGSRAGTNGPKQYAPLAGRALVAHTLAALAAVPRLHATLVVLAGDDSGFEAAAPGFAGTRGWVAHVGGGVG